MSTRLTKPQAETGVRTLSAIIGKIKTDYENPHIVLGGDYNGYDISTLLDDFTDLSVHITPPTRGNRTIDIAITNMEDKISSSRVISPLRNDESQVESDHKIVLVEANWKHSHQFKWVKTWGRQLGEQNIKKCTDAINGFDWEQLVDHSLSPTILATRLHDKLIEIADMTIPWKEYKKRSTDKPWIDDKTRRMVARRQEVFRNKGRNSVDWHELKDKTDDMISTSKKKWYDNETERLMQRGAHQMPYKALGALGNIEGGSNWTPLDMRPGKTEEVAEEFVDHYACLLYTSDAADE